MKFILTVICFSLIWGCKPQTSKNLSEIKEATVIPVEWQGKYNLKFGSGEITISPKSIDVFTEPPQLCHVKKVKYSQHKIEVDCDPEKGCDLSCLKNASIAPDSGKRDKPIKDLYEYNGSDTEGGDFTEYFVRKAEPLYSEPETAATEEENGPVINSSLPQEYQGTWCEDPDCKPYTGGELIIDGGKIEYITAAHPSDCSYKSYMKTKSGVKAICSDEDETFLKLTNSKLECDGAGCSTAPSGIKFTKKTTSKQN